MRIADPAPGPPDSLERTNTVSIVDNSRAAATGVPPKREVWNPQPDSTPDGNHTFLIAVVAATFLLIAASIVLVVGSRSSDKNPGRQNTGPSVKANVAEPGRPATNDPADNRRPPYPTAWPPGDYTGLYQDPPPGK